MKGCFQHYSGLIWDGDFEKLIFRFSADNLKLSTDRKTWVQKCHSVILPSNHSDLLNTVWIQIDCRNVHLSVLQLGYECFLFCVFPFFEHTSPLCPSAYIHTCVPPSVHTPVFVIILYVFLKTSLCTYRFYTKLDKYLMRRRRLSHLCENQILMARRMHTKHSRVLSLCWSSFEKSEHTQAS